MEVASPEEVGAAQVRLAGQGLPTATEENVACCYAVQDKVWVTDPDDAPWEIYTVLADADVMSPVQADGSECECCGSEQADETAVSCC